MSDDRPHWLFFKVKHGFLMGFLQFGIFAALAFSFLLSMLSFDIRVPGFVAHILLLIAVVLIALFSVMEDDKRRRVLLIALGVRNLLFYIPLYMVFNGVTYASAWSDHFMRDIWLHIRWSYNVYHERLLIAAVSFAVTLIVYAAVKWLVVGKIRQST
jgi:hypothetical protein